MAYVDVDLSTLRETMFSRYHSPDRNLYTWDQILPWLERAPTRRKGWAYEPEGPMPQLPVQPLSAQARRSLEKALPF